MKVNEALALPDYRGGSIVNLMSSIAGAFSQKAEYETLRLLPPEKIKDSKNIVLMIIDGLGYEYLKRKGKSTILNEHRLGSITSVFPPTTASAITTFMTGVAPQQHAFTGWYMHLKEVGAVSTILPFCPRFGGPPFSAQGISIDAVLDQKPFSGMIKAQNFLISHKDIAFSDFSKAMTGKSKVLPYRSLNGFFANIRKAIKSGNRRKYIYAYWPELDSLNHRYGVGHKKSEKHFREIDKKIRGLIKSIEGTNTALIITADHGLINTSPERTIKLEDHPKMKECLSLPLCGEARAAYCYVHPEKAQQFESYIRKNMRQCCRLFKSRELINKNYFGLFKPNPKLFDRVGDYALIFRKNYVMRDFIGKENKKEAVVGHHGGVSKEEMLVPLVLVKC